MIDKPLLEALGIDADTELEVSTDGEVLVISPLRNRRRTKKLAEIVAEAHERYGARRRPRAHPVRRAPARTPMLRDPKRGFLSFETWTAWGRRAA